MTHDRAGLAVAAGHVLDQRPGPTSRCPTSPCPNFLLAPAPRARRRARPSSRRPGRAHASATPGWPAGVGRVAAGLAARGLGKGDVARHPRARTYAGVAAGLPTAR